MSQVGWASACGRRDVARARRGVRPRNGPPLAVTTSRRTSSARPPRRHCASAECSESTGRSWPGGARAGDQRPARDERLLVRERDRAPGVEGGERGAQARGAGDRVEHDVARRAAASVDHVVAGHDARHGVGTSAEPLRSSCAASARPTPTTGTRELAPPASASSSTSEPPAASATTSNRSGASRTTSRACVPIDPVEPRTTTRRGSAISAGIPMVRTRAPQHQRLEFGHRLVEVVQQQVGQVVREAVAAHDAQHCEILTVLSGNV